MFEDMIGLSEFWGSGFRCEDLILSFFYLHIGNDNMLKPNNEICLKCKYHSNRKPEAEKNVATDKKESSFFEK